MDEILPPDHNKIGGFNKIYKNINQEIKKKMNFKNII